MGCVEPFNRTPDQIPVVFIYAAIGRKGKGNICPIVMAVDLNGQGSMTFPAHQDDNVLTGAVRAPVIGAGAQIGFQQRVSGRLQVEGLNDIQADIRKSSLY
ncbi:MAG: hypothetical protein P1P76_04395 [Anaerolineales bacterium]|nr:hypothetical protein [Anaerolineales bacterium]